MTITNKIFAFFFIAASSSSSLQAQVTDKTIGVVEKAMTDELARAKSDLHLKGLIDPFFISYTVTDQRRLDIQASNGSIIRSDDGHTRSENVRLLVNNYKFNDENFQDNTSFFSFSSAPDNTLPLDDDYLGIRRSLWLSTDDLFKDANETFSKKKAEFEHKQLSQELKDIPDFSKVASAQIVEAPLQVTYNRTSLEAEIKNLSAIFLKYKNIQSSNASLDFTNTYQWIQNTEGTRVRKPATVCDFKVQATTQSILDGAPLALSIEVNAKTPSELPNESDLSARIEKLANDLIALSNAPVFDKEYTGPVMFEKEAASDFIADNIVARLGAKREDMMGNDVSAIFSSGKGASLQEKLATRVLPTSVSISDLPLTQKLNGIDLMGYYPVDDEGVKPVENLKLVEKGILKTLYMTRTPTKEIREPNGHTRMSGPGPGVVEYKDTKAIASATMRKDLLTRAKEDGYDYALVVRDIQSSVPMGEDAGFSLQDMLANGKMIVPTLMYKMYADGREELVRGAEIGLPSTRDLRELISSKETVITNRLMATGGGGLFSLGAKIPATLIGPQNILCPELEVHKKKPSAYPTLPVVERP